jgi:ferredoxin-NADP reductase
MNRGQKTVETLQLRVSETQNMTNQIRKIVLEHAEGLPLPAAKPGAHVRVHIGGAAEDTRAYSLLMLNGKSDDATHSQYEIAVKREDAGNGGSRYMHALKVGDALVCDAPRNDFMLDPADRSAPVLLAGGIGITPIFAMASALRHEGRPFHLHYAGRDKSQMALLRELDIIAGESLWVHLDQQDTQLDVKVLLQSMNADQHLYVCGPTGLLDTVLAMAKQQGLPAAQVHFELFNNHAASTNADSFQVRLAQSGKTYVVPPDKSILQVLQDQGEDPLCDCCRGECGVCQVGVLEGEPDHRDYVLSDAEKAAGKLMQICVSRSKSPVLVLDL